MANSWAPYEIFQIDFWRWHGAIPKLKAEASAGWMKQGAEYTFCETNPPKSLIRKDRPSPKATGKAMGSHAQCEFDHRMTRQTSRAQGELR